MTIKLTMSIVIPDDVLENAQNLADEINRRSIGFGDANAEMLIKIAIKNQSDIEPYNGQNLSEFIYKGLEEIKKSLFI